MAVRSERAKDNYRRHRIVSSEYHRGGVIRKMSDCERMSVTPLFPLEDVH